MADVQVTSKQYSLNWQDVLKGAIVAVIMAVVTTVEESLRTGAKIDWAMVGSIAIGTLVSYLAKNFFTGATVQKPVTSEEVTALKAGDSKVELVAKA